MSIAQNLTTESPLSDSSCQESSQLTIHPEYKKLQEAIQQLHTELSMLILEHDQLLYTECKNIEIFYLMNLGGLEYRAYDLQCQVLRAKRKLTLIQAKINRQEPVDLVQIEEVLDIEFAQYQKTLNERIDKINQALERSKHFHTLSSNDQKELKRLYRQIVKALHPDLHPDLTKSQLNLFHRATEAYATGDLEAMRLISEMISEPPLLPCTDDSLSLLRQERDRLTMLLQKITDKINKIKSEYPYTLKKLISTPEKIKEEKEKLQNIIADFQNLLTAYQARINTLLNT